MGIDHFLKHTHNIPRSIRITLAVSTCLSAGALYTIFHGISSKTYDANRDAKVCGGTAILSAQITILSGYIFNTYCFDTVLARCHLVPPQRTGKAGFAASLAVLGILLLSLFTSGGAATAWWTS